MPNPGDAKMRGPKAPDPTVKFDREDVDVDEAEQKSGEDLNSTMMSIDVSGLNDGLTKTQIRSDPSLAEVGVHEHHAARRSLSQRWQAFVPTWICDVETSWMGRLSFYTLRLVLIVFSLILQWVIFSQTLSALQVGHPARWLYLMGSLIQLGLVVAAILFKLSPGWIVNLPLSFLALIFSVGATFFSTADSAFFSLNNFPLVRMLNAFYVLALLTCALIGGTSVARQTIHRAVLVALCLICLIPFVANILQNIPLEYSFFGAGFFAAWGGSGWQPVIWVFQGILPGLFLLFLIFSWGSSRKLSLVTARGFARSCALLLFFLCLCSFSLLQKNRVPHVLNFFIPPQLDVGAVEVEVSGQILKIETTQFAKRGLRDDFARDRFILKKGKAEGEFRLSVSDAFGFPVHNLRKDDLNVFVNDQKVIDFKLSEQFGTQENGATYLLGVKLAQASQLISGDFSKRPRTNDEVLEFKISDPTKIKRLVVGDKTETVLDLTNLTGDTVRLPLSYFQEGNYRLTLSAYDHLDQEIFQKEWDVVIKQMPRVDVLLPIEGDTFGNELPVVMLHPALADQSLQQVSYYVDETLFLQATSFVLYQPLSLTGLRDGEHRLTIKVQSSALKEPQVTSVTFAKKTGVAQLVIDEPTMGIFAGREMPVKFHVAGTTSNIAGVKVFVNGQVFADFVLKDNLFTLPATRWSHAELALTLQATLDDGTKLSDWTFVNKGAGIVELSFDQTKLGFLNYKAVSLVFDATVSMWDNWHGREKWQVISKVASESDIDDRLKILNAAVFALGARKPYYYHDCQDHEVLINAGEYNPSILKKKLSEIQPSGVSSLWAVLKEALETRPDKIFIFSDGADHCDADGFNSLQKMIQKSPQTQIISFILGQIDKPDEADLKKLTEMTQGRFYQPEDYDSFLSFWLNELSPHCQIFALDQLVRQEILENKKFALGAGKYVFKILVAGQMKEFPFTVQNGATTILNITGEKDDVKVEVKQAKE